MSVAGEAGGEGMIPTTDRYGTALADIVRCASCGHMQLEPMPAEAELSESYEQAASEDYVAEEAGQRATADAILERIEARVAPGSLLDLGCWVGFFADQARRRGWRPVGVEPSEFAAAYARERLGLEVIEAGVMEAELPEGEFAAAFMGDVIEHLPDPGAALDRVARSLGPGGVLALAIPDAGSRVARTMGRRWWSVIPTHVQYFTRGSIASLLERHGYALLEQTTAPKRFSVRYYLERSGGYSRGLARGLVRGAEAARLADRLWAPDFRDRMLVLAAPR
jgi:SAM-dependent methyltransferase